VPVEAEKHTAPDAELSALIKEGEKIGGLQIAKSLSRIGNDYKTWTAVVRSFIETTPGLLDIMRKFNPDKTEIYTITVHGIKSVCYSFGAFETGDRAKELEDKSRAGDFEYVKNNNAEFIKTTEKLINDLSVLPGVLTAGTSGPIKEIPDRITLLKILEASRKYDINSLDENIAALEKNSYSQEPDLVPWLRKQCDCSDFPAITQRLSFLDNSDNFMNPENKKRG